MTEEVQLQDQEEFLTVCGPLRQNIDHLEEELSVNIIDRGNKLIIQGDQSDQKQTVKLLNDYLDVLRKGNNGTDLKDFAQAWMKDSRTSTQMANETILVSRNGSRVQPRTVSQQQYIDAVRNHDVVFGIGPAGTGKTYLAIAMALSFLSKERISRIVLARPAVEAGESLGFLPGDLQEKVNPYLRPLYDAIYNLMDIRDCERMLEEGTIEVAPLAFMRGRTLSDSFVILDEAQNTTVSQMKMFLTRFGPNSRTVVNGDITQIDLPQGKKSGLIHAREILKGVDGIAFTEFGQDEVVRHDLVQRIIEAYDEDDP